MILAGLLLASTAARAQQPAAPRYLMLVHEKEIPTGPTHVLSALTVIEPDGTMKTEEFATYFNSISKKALNASLARGIADSTTLVMRRNRYAHLKVYQAELLKLNEYTARGWTLVSTTHEGLTTRYLLRQDGPVLK